MPAAFDAADTGEAEGSVASWPTNGGFVLQGYRARGHYWLEAEEVAVFRFGDEGPVYVTGDDPDGDTVQSAWLNSVLPLVVQARGTQVLHASANLGGAGVVALCGTSGAGKSTLAARMAERGHRAVADDALPYTVQADAVMTHPLPFILRPRASQPEPLNSPSDERHPLQAIVILRPNEANTPVLTAPLRPAAALGALMPHAYCFSLDETKRELLDAYASLVAQLPVYELNYPHEPAAVDSTAGVLEDLLA